MIAAVSVDEGLLRAGVLVMPCRIGRGGICPAAAKREGDGRTPTGTWAIRAALLRRDRGIAPPTRFPWRWLRPGDGWCDAPGDPAYNRAVRLPYPASAERMWRDDAAYDAVLVLAHNDAPPIAGRGSAIFVHVETGGATEGCVAIAADAMRALLVSLSPGDQLRVVSGPESD